ncbi:hypothetical protein NEMBOFW57_002070 [Staphylotrichum longicolle]|uniref:NAD-dependent epimerase/dehydratase domain-containing protein n=1 Tax=Staphylotrichum longicolle TaxID=669026 RepID=A0AAD4HYE3_9PEZI|nr:hypothetical protein NEMBOFW57_002070 [Staphylotrichum longicolle]
MYKPTVLVTGSAGHLGKALMLALPDLGYHPIGIDIKPSSTTTLIGSITDTTFLDFVFATYQPVHIIHAATLHKPHICSHTKHEFIQPTSPARTPSSSRHRPLPPALPLPPNVHAIPATNPTVKSFIFISTTSTFGHALAPPPGEPAAWIDESVVPQPKNIYGVTKTAAEDVCRLAHKQTGLPILVLRMSRFFPEEDDDEERRGAMGGDNLKVLELASRRVDLADAVAACVCAMDKAGRGEGKVGWGTYIVSGPTPFKREDGVLRGLDEDAGRVFETVCPGVGEVFERKGWRFLRRVDRVYDSGRAVRELGWKPVYTFQRAVEMVGKGEEWRSELSLWVGKLGYHAVSTGVYTTREDNMEAR